MNTHNQFFLWINMKFLYKISLKKISIKNKKNIYQDKLKAINKNCNIIILQLILQLIKILK